MELRGHTGSPDAFLGAVVLDTPLKMNGWNTGIRRWKFRWLFPLQSRNRSFSGVYEKYQKSRVDSEKG